MGGDGETCRAIIGAAASAQPSSSRRAPVLNETQPSDAARVPDAVAQAGPHGPPDEQSAAPESPAGEQRAAAPESPAGEPSAPPKAPGVIAQLRATIAAGRRLAVAHVGLARTELSAILADAKEVALLGGIALALVLFVAMLLPIGMTLFLGEWLFGSMGWGVLHGTELSLATAVVLIFVALRVPRGFLGRMLAVAVVVGAVVAVALGSASTNAAWTRLGDGLFLGVDAAVRPLVTAVVVGAAALAVVGFLAGWRAAGHDRRVSGAIPGLLAGLVAGALLGAVSAISFSAQVGVAIGVAVGFALWPALSGLALRGYDWEALATRFTPTTTIETTQESIEWLQQTLQRMRPGTRS